MWNWRKSFERHFTTLLIEMSFKNKCRIMNLLSLHKSHWFLFVKLNFRNVTIKVRGMDPLDGPILNAFCHYFSCHYFHMGERVREACNKKKTVKWVTFIKKGGWGQNFMKTNFFFAIVTLGGYNFVWHNFPPLIFPYSTYF